MDIKFTKRTEHVKYGERLGPPVGGPLTLEGYCEVYELDGMFFGVHETEDGAGGRSQGYKTQAEAVAALEEVVAFHRSFWDEKIEWRKNDDKTTKGPHFWEVAGQPVVRANHRHYVLGEDPKPGQSTAAFGHGGRKFVFRMLTTGEVVTSRNVWSQGEIPAEYWVRLPDNAEQLEP